MQWPRVQYHQNANYAISNLIGPKVQKTEVIPGNWRCNSAGKLFWVPLADSPVLVGLGLVPWSLALLSA
jgi:hypothetical protein